MHRSHLLDQLDDYLHRHPGERDRVEQFRRFVTSHPDCFLRSCVPGHITASAWVLSADRQHFLLTHHRKLDKWLQLGGHVDGEPQPWRAALREAQEESGMWDLSFPRDRGEIRPLDLDVHPIPARGDEPTHLHYDLRFLLIAAPGQPLRVSDESHDLRWFPMAELERWAPEESVARIGRKAGVVLAGRGDGESGVGL